MKTLREILLLLAVAAGTLALCGTERADGSADLLWFIGWALAAALFAYLSKLNPRRHV